MVVNLVQGIEKSIRFKTGVVDFTVTNAAASKPALVLIPQQISVRASFTIAHSSLNDSKWIDSSVCSN